MADPLRELVLPRLEGVKPATGGGYMARCPAHPDNKPSLSVKPGRDQPVLLKCYADCETVDILDKLGLTFADITNSDDDGRRPAFGQAEWTPAGPAAAVYDYVDEGGALLFQVLRTVNKDFRQRRPDPNGKNGWTWRLDDTRRVLYRLPRVIAAVQEGREVYICEGEKDVHTLEAAGLVATCNSGGAGKWRPEYVEFLKEAVVTIVADRDEPGQKHARQVRDALVDVAACVTIAEAAEGKDATDHVNAGHDLAALVTTWTNDAPTKVDLAPDLWEFLATEDAPYDWLVPGLIERGDRVMITGFEGLGKSMLIRQMAVTMAAGIDVFLDQAHPPCRVLVIDCENSDRQSRRKYRGIGQSTVDAGRPVPNGGLRLIHRPEGIDLTRGEDAEWLLERVTAHRPDILFVGPFYRLHAGNMNDELPARKAVSILDKARTAGDGCALVIEAHAGHGQDSGKSRSVRPTGSSLLLRWPEFGFGLSPFDQPDGSSDPARTVELRHWRGQRDERAWPRFLTWGNRWPWVSADKKFAGATP